MDRLIVLDQGRIVEQARTRSCCAWATIVLWRHQSGGFIDVGLQAAE